jgi:gliding motility-associated-like protein
MTFILNKKKGNFALVMSTNNPFIYILLVIFVVGHKQGPYGQSLIINELSNGPSGNQEYIEFLVVDNTIQYDCNTSEPPCIDIRGWIFDDNSGYHGTGGVAAGAARFSYNSLWACVPVGTIILIYNNQDPNVNLPPDDVSLTDGNCRLIIPMNHPTLMENNPTTPGAAACSYPITGWGAGGIWTYTVFANPGDCGRIVDLSGCEVFSMCYGSCNSNNLIYFAGAGGQKNWYFNGGDPYIQSNWSMGTAAVNGGNETPGEPNNALNAAYIAQFNNNCTPITLLESNVLAEVPASCGCTGSAEIAATGSIGPYTYQWLDENMNALNVYSVSISNLCTGIYYAISTSSISCTDTLIINIADNSSGSQLSINTTICQNSSYQFPDGTTQIITTPVTTTYNLTDSFGCDSVVHLTIAINPVYSLTEQIELCINSNHTFPDGTSLTVQQNTVHVSTLTSNLGCDSVITTEIILIDTFEMNELTTVCIGASLIMPDGTTVNNIVDDFIHISTFTSSSGCDSLLITQINVLPSYSIADSLYFCEGQEVILPNGTEITNFSPGMNFPITFLTEQGCDSTITYYIFVRPIHSSYIDASVCNQSIYTFPDGSSWLVVNDTIQVSYLLNEYGCDSVLTTTVSRSANYQIELFDTICSGLNYTFSDGTTQNNVVKDIIYIYSLTNQSGCDSTIISYLTVLESDNTEFLYTPLQPTADDEWITFFPKDSSIIDFYWQIFDSNEQLLNNWNDTVLNLSLIQHPSNAYVVCLSSNNANNCPSQTCEEIIPTGNIYIYVPNAFTPNRDGQNDFFSPVITGRPFMNYEFTIFNRWGEVVFYSTEYQESWDGTYLGEISPLGSYVYTLYLKEVGNVNDYRYTGHVSIVR